MDPYHFANFVDLLENRNVCMRICCSRKCELRVESNASLESSFMLKGN
jgi:hypothetical protein